MSDSPRSAPVGTSERISSLDAVRGVAVLGILTMNAVSYGLEPAAYFNLDGGGSDTWLDWGVGGVGEVFFDQKFMGLFSLLFGAGIVLFADRAAAKGRRPVLFSLWRNALLLGIGVVHALFWDGDILVVYAICAPVLIVLRRLSPRLLVIIGTAVVLSSALFAALAQSTVDGDGLSQIGDGYWYDEGALSDAVGIWLLADFFARALGMMLIGTAVYRLGVITGDRPTVQYRRMARWGLLIGLPLSAAGLALVVADDFSPGVAVVGSVPNTVATIPVVLGYVGVIVIWNQGGPSRLRSRIRAAGRMALTNYLAQTAIGLIALRGILDRGDVDRSGLVVFILAVWLLQLWYSEAWLARFRYGPAEWAWRCATYRSWQSMRIPEAERYVSEPPTRGASDRGGP